mgnify:CR=1 FL=1
MFAIEHHDTTPDIMCVAKGLTSGYLPLGATIVSSKIAKHFDENPLVAQAALSLIKDTETLGTEV